MAKDPAFLFYSDNFQSGTQFFTDEQVGKYIRLLCAQHLHGHLTKKQVLLICKTSDDDTNEILAKFKLDNEGKYYNERLEFEVERRRKFTESRVNNRLGKFKKDKKNTRKTSEKHLGNGNENRNNINNGVGFFKPTLEEVKNYCKERKNMVDPGTWFDFYESKGWMIGKNKMKDWKAAVRTWEKNTKQDKPTW